MNRADYHRQYAEDCQMDAEYFAARADALVCAREDARQRVRDDAQLALEIVRATGVSATSHDRLVTAVFLQLQEIQ